jgi:hypothetical protein
MGGHANSEHNLPFRAHFMRLVQTTHGLHSRSKSCPQQDSIKKLSERRSWHVGTYLRLALLEFSTAGASMFLILHHLTHQFAATFMTFELYTATLTF